MKFEEVALKNFFRYGNNEQVFKLNRGGIWNITGINGVGKSSIIEAIVWCLFGKTRQDTLDEIVNRKTKKDCKVSVTFSNDEITYKVIRYRAHTVHKNDILFFKNDEDITGHTAAETNQLIQDVLGFNYITFVNSTIFSSTLYNKFLDAENKERLIVMENLLDLKQITAFYAATKGFIKETKKELEEVNIKFSARDATLESAKNALSSYKESAKNKLLELKRNKQKAEDDKKILEKAKKELLEINIEEEKEKINNKNYLNELKEKLDKKTRELQMKKYASKEAVEFVEKYSGVDFSSEISKFESNKIKQEEKEKILKEIEEKKSLIKDLEKEVLLNEEKKKDIQNQIDEIDEKLKTTIAGECPTCHQKINEKEIEEKKKLYELQRKEKLSDLNSLSNINDKKNEIIVLLDNIKELKNKFDSAIIEQCINNPEVIKEKYEKYKIEVDSVDSTNKIIDTHNEIISSELKEIKDEIDKCGNPKTSWTIEKLENLKDSLKDLDKKISQCDIDIATAIGSVSSAFDKNYVLELEENIKKTSSDKEEVFVEKQKLEEDEKYYNYLADCFSNKSNGFKKFFIGEMIDAFNDNINQYLPFFFNEKVSIKFDKDLNDTIEMDDVEISYNSFSKGQKTRAELAIAFALFGLSRYYYSNSNNILMVDEMLDDGLDEFGIRSSLNILSGFSDSTVYIISHNDNVKELIDNRITIERDENTFSVIKE